MSKHILTQFVPSLKPLAVRSREAARLLSVSEKTLYLWTRAGELPCIRVGQGKRNAVLYRIVDLETWLARAAQTSSQKKDLAGLVDPVAN
jgi:excisionase family DNA binding protein